jgi:hypothetical protein
MGHINSLPVMFNTVKKFTEVILDAGKEVGL